MFPTGYGVVFLASVEGHVSVFPAKVSSMRPREMLEPEKEVIGAYNRTYGGPPALVPK